MKRIGAALLVLLSACRGTVERPPEPATAAVRATAPRWIAFDGDPNGLLWHDGRLLAADDDHNRVMVWREGASFTTLVELPPVGDAHVSLGGLAQLSDGTLVIARLGDVGDVVVVRPDRPPQIVAGLDPQRRRIGLAVGPDDRVYATWFVRDGDARRGGVEAIDLAGGARDLVTGLQKPVGVIVLDGALAVSDQFAGRIVRISLDEPPRVTEIAADLRRPDLLAALPDGSLLTGDANGRVLAVDRAGGVRELANGLPGARGLAVDLDGRRLFVALHGGDGAPSRIAIVPLP